jgi:putative ABC transport system permease protein
MTVIFYNLLLHLYPSSFRHEYGEELRAIFRRRLRDARGPLEIAGLWISTLGEVVVNAAFVHLDILGGDLRYSLRTCIHAPGFAFTAVAMVALGIGATASAFSVTDFVLIRPLPFPEPERLVKVWERTAGYRMELSPANYRDWTAAATVFERIGSYHAATANLVGSGDPLRVEGAAVSADLLPTLRVQPLLGRIFNAADDQNGASGTVLLSYRLWQTRFGGDAAIVGQQVRLNSESHTVIGVMPKEFQFPSSDSQYWTTLRFSEENYVDRGDNWMYAVGRLRQGVTLAAARAELDVTAGRSRAQYPKENANVGAMVLRFSDDVTQQTRLLLYALCGASGCVLLIACANLANLLLARALGRRRELAVRTAIGAGRERMVRQLLTESLLVASIGGAIGVGVAYAAVPLLIRVVPTTLPLASSPTVDLRVLVFAIAATLLTGLIFGLAPVLRFSGEADLGGLREGTRVGGGRRERVRSTLVIVEIAASVVLLSSAGLLIRALWTVQAIQPGFRPDGVLTLQTPLPMPQYGKVATRETYYGRVISEVRAIPGVVDAAFVSYLPMGRMRGGIWPVSVDGQVVNRADNKNAFLRYVTPGYFATLNIPMLSGRDVTAADDSKRQPVGVISESFIRRYWPGESPASVLGRHFSFANSDRVVIGVVRDVKMRGLEREAEPQVYLSSRQVGDDSIIGYVPRGLVVRASTPPEALVSSLRAIVKRADPVLPVSEVAMMTELVERDTASRLAQLRVLGAFALIAFVLAGIGIHGLLSFTVSQRAQEIGVRMALGAQSGDILSMVTRRSMLLALGGVIPGVTLAYAAGRSMEALLAGVRPADAPTLLAVVALSIVMTLLGSAVPTIRALKVDPLTALRAE